MKTLMILALAALTLPLFAGPAAIRVDVDATKQLIPIKKTAGEGKLSKGHWLPAEKQNCYLYLSKPVTDEWSDFIFTVVPEKSGDIRLNIGGEWSKEPGDREFVLIDDVTVNGEPVANGSFGSAMPKSCISFVSRASHDAGIKEKYGLQRIVYPVHGCRQIGKPHMVLNGNMPKIDVNPETFEVFIDGRQAYVKPAQKFSLAQLYWFS